MAFSQNGFTLKLEYHKALYWPSFVFLLYINDIVKNVGPNIRLFADDTSLFIIVDNPTTAALCFNTDPEKLSRLGCYLVSHLQPFQADLF